MITHFSMDPKVRDVRGRPGHRSSPRPAADRRAPRPCPRPGGRRIPRGTKRPRGPRPPEKWRARRSGEKTWRSLAEIFYIVLNFITIPIMYISICICIYIYMYISIYIYLIYIYMSHTIDTIYLGIMCCVLSYVQDFDVDMHLEV